MDTPDTSIAIKRAPRTYSRQQKPIQDHDRDRSDPNDTSFTASSSGDTSLDHLLSSPGAVPPESSDNEAGMDSSMTRDDEDDEENNENAREDDGSSPLKSFRFSWRDDLRKIDERVDDDDDLLGAPLAGDVALNLSAPSVHPRAVLGPIHLDRSASFHPQRASPELKGAVNADMNMEISDDDPFEGELPVLTSSSQPTQRADESDSQDEHEYSPRRAGSQPRSTKINRISRRVPTGTHRRAIIDSDAEADSDVDPNSDADSDKGRVKELRARNTSRSSPTPETSPDKLHYINTPQTRPGEQTTPPTSQEMSSKATGRDKGASKDKGKGKARIKLKSKGKGRATSAVQESSDEGGAAKRREAGSESESDDNDPLAKAVFDDGRPRRRRKANGKGKETEKRVKALTHKERIEAQKATARIKADQPTSIHPTTQRLRVTGYLEHLRVEKTATPTVEKPSTPSDPIEPASSSPQKPPRTSTKPLLLPALTLRGATTSKARAGSRARTVEPSGSNTGSVLVSNVLPGLTMAPATMRTYGRASASTGKAREKQRLAQQARAGSMARSTGTGASRSRTGTPVDPDANVRGNRNMDDEDVFMAPAAARGPMSMPQYSLPPSDPEESEEEELPDVRDIIVAKEREEHERAEAERKKQMDKQRAEALRARKLALLREQEERRGQDAEAEDDDDELDIVDEDARVVAREEMRERQAKKVLGTKESEGRARQLAYARIPPKARGGVIRESAPSLVDERVSEKDELRALAAASRPAFFAAASAHTRDVRGRNAPQVIPNKNSLNRILLKASNDQSREVTIQKEKEYYRKAAVDGLPTERWREEQAKEQATARKKEERLRELVERGIAVAQKRENQEDEDGEWDDEEGSDREWQPQNVDEEKASGSDSEVMNELPVATEDEGHDPPTVDGHENDENEDEGENVLHAPHRHVRKRRLDSDDEMPDQNAPAPSYGRILVPNSSQGRILVPNSSQGEPEQVEVHGDVSTEPPLVHRTSVSSAEDTDRAEESTDKENNELLMFDRGEDKENTTIAQQPSSPTPLPLRRALSGGDGEPVASPSTEVRSPLKDIPHDVFGPVSPVAIPRHSSPVLATPAPRPRALQFGHNLDALTSDELFAPRPKSRDVDDSSFKTPNPRAGAGTSSLEPAAVIVPGGGGGGFSQFFDEENSQGGPLSAVPRALKGGFSQFETPAKGSGSGFDKLRGSDLALTMKAPKPVLDVDQGLLQKADELFEKEQQLLVNEAVALAAESIPEAPVYANRHGFLTQTRPDSSHKPLQLSSPLVITPLFKTQQSSATRRPLSTLALSSVVAPTEEDEDEDEEESLITTRRSRLRKRVGTPDKGVTSSSSPSPHPKYARMRNAFDVLGKNAPLAAPQFGGPKGKGKAKRLEKSEFVEGEAEESDEEVSFGFGFGKRRKGDDDEDLDGEDQDQELEGLMDNTAMDEDTLNEQKVLEKVQEHRAMDDAVDEKIARDAAEGKLRAKRRNRGIDFDSDESDDEDDPDAKYRRQKMNKKRRIDGDSLDELARHQETMPFVEAYKAEIEDDNEEFAHLENDDYGTLNLGGNNVETEEDTGDDGLDDIEPKRVVTSSANLRKEIQIAAREKKFVTIDPEDVTWTGIDSDDEVMHDDDLGVAIKELNTVSNRPPRPAQANAIEGWEAAPLTRGGTAQDRAREQKWARTEGGSRHGGTGRASAVTSMLTANAVAAPKPGVRAGGGSLAGRGKGTMAPPQAGPSRTGSSANKRGAKLTKTGGALSAAGLSRRDKFAK